MSDIFPLSFFQIYPQRTIRNTVRWNTATGSRKWGRLFSVCLKTSNLVNLHQHWLVPHEDSWSVNSSVSFTVQLLCQHYHLHENWDLPFHHIINYSLQECKCNALGCLLWKCHLLSIISHFHAWTNEVAVGCIQCRRRLCHLSVSLVSVYKKEKRKKKRRKFFNGDLVLQLVMAHAVSVINAEVIQYKLLQKQTAQRKAVFKTKTKPTKSDP